MGAVRVTVSLVDPLILGAIHLDQVTHRLLVDGVPACTGCGRPCDARFCGHVCEVKRSAELRLIRRQLLPILSWAGLPARARAISREDEDEDA